MQKYCTELTERLLKSLDKEYNVVDMGAVVDVITALEKTAITKEVLEITRLGKFINELRRKTNNEALARRAKDLVRRWREMVLPSVHSTPQPTVADTAPPALNGAKPQSPALRSLKPQSPALKGLKPQSPLLKTTSLRVLSPSLSVHSENSRSPNASALTVSSNHRLKSGEPSPELNSKVQNHSSEAVPRTHSSNKRLRKDELAPEKKGHEPPAKRQRLNGETVNDSSNGSNSSSSSSSCGLNSQVPSPCSAARLEQPLLEDKDAAPELKKRGRKKGSKSLKKQSLLEDSVKEKLASISRNPKLKTTQELLADLQARGSSTLLPSHSISTPNVEDVLRGESHQGPAQNNFSQAAHCDPELTEPDSPDEKKHQTDEASDFRESHSRPWRELTAEEILSKLPPLDLESIDWKEDEECERLARPVTHEDVSRLHGDCVEGLNGNFQPRLASLSSSPSSPAVKREERTWTANSSSTLYRCPRDRTDEDFREWHEMLARPSYDGQILHILPYVIID